MNWAMLLCAVGALASLSVLWAQDVTYSVTLLERGSTPLLSFMNGTSAYRQVANPSWIEASAGTNGKKGLLVRTQDCDFEAGHVNCTWCGGSQEKASILTFSQQLPNGWFTPVTRDSVVFSPGNDDELWGTEDPRIQYNDVDGLYYMFYTAYNRDKDNSVFLSLATTPDPTSPHNWTRHGPVFPTERGSKSGALLLRDQAPHYLLWGDLDIRIAESNDPKRWPTVGDILFSPRSNRFDSRLVESGPPPLRLSNGDYLFLYNSAQLQWPENPKKNYYVGWVILDGTNPKIIKARSASPLLGPQFAWETGQHPYLCNAPNVVFLEAAYPVGQDKFVVFFGGADANIGQALIKVSFSVKPNPTPATPRPPMAKNLTYSVTVLERGATPVLSYVDGTSDYQQVHNPTWVEPSAATQGKKGLIVRTQDCDFNGTLANCTWCGGAGEKASLLTFSQQLDDGSFARITRNSVVFEPDNDDDWWGTEDPRIQYNPHDGLYYMFYTAYNGTSIQLSLATTPDPTVGGSWTRHGFVFPKEEKSKSGSLLLRDQPPHHLIWGDKDVRIAQSNDPAVWPDRGQILISPRSDHFDSLLVESGPPPLKLSNGDYLFIYNSAEEKWSYDLSKNYLVGWVILDANDPTKIKARSATPLMGPKYAWETGQHPYVCNAPNVVFLEAAYPIGQDQFVVFFGGADANIGQAVIKVSYSETAPAPSSASASSVLVSVGTRLSLLLIVVFF
ncbi:hypothetical protein RvY_18800 [Ramazzottius varieornatus]|uniref:Uncharacterized protein n=1 Tax=Ramazzottius varieornatus TaxID=947166 RepID=A0A1D1W7D0_RAMVA|nr:hypothetical protein RvY_18800 [Ramazzottius varieornatus]